MREAKRIPWTQFMDMHSGGGTKIKPYEYIYIQAREEEAKAVFYNRFGRNPDCVTCTCCGSDYSISEYATIKEATAYQRGCAFAYKNSKGKEVAQDQAWVRGKGLKKGYSSGYVERACTECSFTKEYLSLKEYQQRSDVLFISNKEIKASERNGHIPDQGYVWVGA